LTITITDEFREKVNKAARSVAGRNSAVDWEDISQDMWVWFLQNPEQYDKYTNLEDPFRELKKIARQELYKQNNALEFFSGNYTYTPAEVRGLLNQYLIDVELEAVAEHVDLTEGLLMLRSQAPSYFKTIINKWVHGTEGNRGMTSHSVDKLTRLMNQVHQAARYSYEGPGNRRVVSNSAANAWTDLERGQSMGSKYDRDWMKV
jgi:hypothetical protein